MYVCRYVMKRTASIFLQNAWYGTSQGQGHGTDRIKHIAVFHVFIALLTL